MSITLYTYMHYTRDNNLLLCYCVCLFRSLDTRTFIILHIIYVKERTAVIAAHIRSGFRGYRRFSIPRVPGDGPPGIKVSRRRPVGGGVGRT